MKQITYSQRNEDVKRTWALINVEGQILGKMATKIATLLIGKHKVTYTPHIDGGDYVIVTNAAKIVVTGRKSQNKIYRHHSLFPGGLREQTFEEVLAKHPEKIIEIAVHNMLPKNKLRDPRMSRLKVYPGVDHPHQSQVAKTS